MTRVRFSGRTHELKTWPGPYDAVRAGLKPWELRRNDRDYQVGDLLWLKEWDPATETFTGAAVARLVVWMLAGGQFGLPEGHVIMTLEPWGADPRPATQPTKRRDPPKDILLDGEDTGLKADDKGEATETLLRVLHRRGRYALKPEQLDAACHLVMGRYDFRLKEAGHG